MPIPNPPVSLPTVLNREGKNPMSAVEPLVPFVVNAVFDVANGVATVMGSTSVTSLPPPAAVGGLETNTSLALRYSATWATRRELVRQPDTPASSACVPV